MSIDETIRVGNILYIIDEEGCELYERVDKITDDLMITNNGSWYLKTLGSSWQIKEVVGNTRHETEQNQGVLIRANSPQLESTEQPDQFREVTKMVLEQPIGSAESKLREALGLALEGNEDAPWFEKAYEALSKSKGGSE